MPTLTSSAFMEEHPGGGCFTCRYSIGRGSRPLCQLHKIVPNLPKVGCSSWEREPGADDERPAS